MSTVAGTSSTQSGGYTPQSSTASAPTSPVTENMFLQLLVAQLKNQDPTNPTDSTAFVTQLAQFQTLSQSLNQGQDVTAIRNDLDTLIASQSTTKSSNS